MVSISQRSEELRLYILQPGLGFDNFKPRLKTGIFKCITWLDGSLFGGDDRGFLKEGVSGGATRQVLVSRVGSNKRTPPSCKDGGVLLFEPTREIF